MAPTFVVDKDVLGRYQWHLKADNGKIIARSGEPYPNRKAARDAIKAVMASAPGAQIDDDNVDKVASEKVIAEAHKTAIERQRKLKELYEKRFPNGTMI